MQKRILYIDDNIIELVILERKLEGKFIFDWLPTLNGSRMLSKERDYELVIVDKIGTTLEDCPVSYLKMIDCDKKIVTSSVEPKEDIKAEFVLKEELEGWILKNLTC